MTAPVRRPPVVPAGPRLAARAAQERGERRARLRRRVVLGGLALVPLAVLAWVLLASPLFAVRDVRVEGVGRLTPQQVRLAAEVEPGTPLARVDTATVQERVAALSPVADVDVDRDWPHVLRLRVTERVPLGVVAGADGGWRLVDRTGTTFGAVPQPPDDLARVQVAPTASPTDAALGAAVDVLGQLPPALRAAVAEVQAASPVSVTLQLRDGRTVAWGAPDAPARKATVVEALLRRPGRTVDVTAPDVAVVR